MVVVAVVVAVSVMVFVSLAVIEKKREGSLVIV